MLRILIAFFITFTTCVISCCAQDIERHLILDTLPLNLEEITLKADKIFSGSCTGIEKIDYDPQSRLSVVKYKFQITENIKGVSENEITFKQWQTPALRTPYAVGKKYLLFLYPESNLGLTSTVGHLQGHFEVIKVKTLTGVSEAVINKQNNKGLSRNLRTQKSLKIKDDPRLENYLSTTSEKGEPIRYSDFVKAINYFIKQ